MQLSDILIPLSSLAALLLPGILKADHFSDWLNGVIAAAVVALFAAATVWAGGQFTGNLVADWALFAGAYSALLGGPLRPLDQWIQSNVSLPFLPKPVEVVVPQFGKPVTTSAYVPPNIPSRASNQQVNPPDGTVS